MRRQMYVLMCAAVLMAGFAVNAKAQKPPVGEASITLLTSNPALGVVVSFAVTVPKQQQHETIGVHVLCYLVESTGELGYGEIAHWYQGFTLGGSSSLWLNAHSAESTHCVAEEFYWDNHGQYITLATTQFDAAGA